MTTIMLIFSDRIRSRWMVVCHDPPTEVGWYPTLHTWDAREGLFPGAHYWTGTEWQPTTTASISHWPVRFDNEEEARAYADKHDPDL